jgi:hypothetical protein
MKTIIAAALAATAMLASPAKATEWWVENNFANRACTLASSIITLSSPAADYENLMALGKRAKLEDLGHGLVLVHNYDDGIFIAFFATRENCENFKAYEATQNQAAQRKLDPYR